MHMGYMCICFELPHWYKAIPIFALSASEFLLRVTGISGFQDFIHNHIKQETGVSFYEH